MANVCLQYEQFPALLFLFSYKILERKQAVESSISESVMNIGKLSLMTTLVINHIFLFYMYLFISSFCQSCLYITFLI